MPSAHFQKINFSDLSHLANLIKNKKYIFVIGPSGIGKTVLIENLSNNSMFKEYKLELSSEFLKQEKITLADGPKFVEIQKTEDIEQYLKKINNFDEEILEFFKNGAIILMWPNKLNKGKFEKEICQISDENFSRKVKNNIVDFCILTDLKKIRFGFLGYAEAFRKKIKYKLEQDKGDKMKERTLDINNTEDAKKKVSDIKVSGNPDVWQLIAKASSEKEGWMKSTKAMDTGNGCLVQTTTIERNPDGSKVIFETVTFVPNVEVKIDKNGNKYISVKGN